MVMFCLLRKVRPECREGRGSQGRSRRPSSSPAPCRAALEDRAGAPGRGAGSASARTKPVIERASAARSATVRLEAFGATAREREVATLLARGLSRVEIAESLVLSPHTVEDHTKSLYDKVGVASRQELVRSEERRVGKECNS